MKLQAYARITKMLFLFVYMPLVLISSLVQWVYTYIIPIQKGFIIPSHTATTLMAGIVDGTSLVIITYIAYYCARLLDRYKSGEAFSVYVLKLYTKIQRLVILWAIYNPIKNSLLDLLRTIHNPPGQRIIAFAFTSQDMYHILVVGLLIILSSVMQAACELKEEHDLTV